MAMGRRSRDEAERAIRSRRPFKNSTGSFYGTRGTTRTLGWLESHTDARRIRELLSRATYVVWSYGTPIGCVSTDESGDEYNFYFDENHSMTTSHHQSNLRVAFSDFESIGNGPWSRRGSRRPRRPVSRTAPSAPQRLVPAPETLRPSREQMLDRRYADPDWTPWNMGSLLGNLPAGADQRDAERARTEGPWTP